MGRGRQGGGVKPTRKLFLSLDRHGKTTIQQNLHPRLWIGKGTMSSDLLQTITKTFSWGS